MATDNSVSDNRKVNFLNNPSLYNPDSPESKIKNSQKEYVLKLT